VSTATLVPETRGLSGEDAWTTLRRVGRKRLFANAFMRLRVSDGFSHARSLAYTTSLVAVQGVIGVVALAVAIGSDHFSDIVGTTLKTIVPGPAGGVLADAVGQATMSGTAHRSPAILVGLIGPMVTASTAFGQIERGFNRIYGVEQDRPSVPKYTRAFFLALTAGSLTMGAFLCLALGREVISGVAWNVVRWPLGLLTILVAMTLVLYTCPRRRQPPRSWGGDGAAGGTAQGVVVNPPHGVEHGGEDLVAVAQHLHLVAFGGGDAEDPLEGTTHAVGPILCQRSLCHCHRAPMTIGFSALRGSDSSTLCWSCGSVWPCRSASSCAASAAPANNEMALSNDHNSRATMPARAP
jgi:uncharacterized BrkB/YihY/UPF0761 family membrane protein